MTNALWLITFTMSVFGFVGFLISFIAFTKVMTLEKMFHEGVEEPPSDPPSPPRSE